jgi:putative NIF3 family GTP cyclohydrolase 1 type 2
MKLKALFKEIINIGIENDPRGKEIVLSSLEEINKTYKGLSEKEKKYFDLQKLENPYMDSRIYNGNDDEEIKTVMVGIDIETPELLLLDKLKSKGNNIDLAIAHHPEGMGLTNLANVMNLQTDLLHKFGVPINIAENIMSQRINDVSKSLLPVNYSRAIDAAKLLNIAFLGVHTPADNCVAKYLQDLFDKKNPCKLKDILDLLLDIEEYQDSYKSNNAPKILVGSKNSRCGKIYVDMTGGTEGPAIAIEKLVNAGIGTIVGMHLSEKHLKTAKENNMNVVIAGHICSDNLGLNLLFDEIENRLGNLEFICCSGYNRVKRK